MARKTRRQKQRAAARQGTPARTPPRPDGRPLSTAPASLGGDLPLDAESETDFDAPLEDTAAPEAVLGTPAASTPPAAPAAAAPVPAPGSRRRIERLSQASQPARPGRPGRGPANAAAMFQPLETEDAAIPFDRVPYVPADLRRVAVMALLMVALIIIAAVVVTHVVH